MKKRNPQEPEGIGTPEQAEPELPKLKLPKSPSRRSLLKGGAAAVAASGLASLFTAGRLQGQVKPGDTDEVPDNEEPLEVSYDLDRFEDGPPPPGPGIVEGEDVEITAADFTRGMSGIIGSVRFLDNALKGDLLNRLATIEAHTDSGDADGAIAELDAFRLQVINNADLIDAAVGPFAFAEVTSFTQTIIVLVDYLISLRTRIIGVIWVFPWGQIVKVLEVFEQYTVCLTVIQRQVFTLYLRFFLFILVVRFQFFPGLRISIDIILLFITICIRVTIIRAFRICLTRTRRYLLLVLC